MWVFTNKGFISVVRNKSKRWELLVSSPIKGQIETLLPGAQVQEKPGNDLMYFASVHQAIVAEMLAGEVRSIEYECFNESIGDRNHHAVCVRVAKAQKLACRTGK